MMALNAIPFSAFFKCLYQRMHMYLALPLSRFSEAFSEPVLALNGILNQAYQQGNTVLAPFLSRHKISKIARSLAVAFVFAWAGLAVIPVLPLVALLLALTWPLAAVLAWTFLSAAIGALAFAHIAARTLPKPLVRLLGRALHKARITTLAYVDAALKPLERFGIRWRVVLGLAVTSGSESPRQVWSSSLDVDDLVAASSSPSECSSTGSWETPLSTSPATTPRRLPAAVGLPPVANYNERRKTPPRREGFRFDDDAEDSVTYDETALRRSFRSSALGLNLSLKDLVRSPMKMKSPFKWTF